MNFRSLSERLRALEAKYGPPAARMPSVVSYPFEDGPPTSEDIARRFGAVGGCCMLVPTFDSLEAWEAVAEEAQRKLKAEVRT